MCLNRDLCFFWVSSLAYPNLLGKKGFVVIQRFSVKLYKTNPYEASGNSMSSNLKQLTNMDLKITAMKFQE